jgi:hypothetical protein
MRLANGMDVAIDNGTAIAVCSTHKWLTHSTFTSDHTAGMDYITQIADVTAQQIANGVTAQQADGTTAWQTGVCHR